MLLFRVIISITTQRESRSLLNFVTLQRKKNIKYNLDWKLKKNILSIVEVLPVAVAIMQKLGLPKEVFNIELFFLY